MDASTLAAYDRPVPRYTSYPTAAQFDGAVGPDQHRDWLRDLSGRMTAFYLHVPFCRRLCWYCACHTAAVNHQPSLESYARRLGSEIDRVAAIVPDLVVGAIRWGGGTPSQLGGERIADVTRRIAGAFDRESGAETSIEIDPRFCDDRLVDALAGAGFDRASFGVQDFDIDVQRAINRLQSTEQTAGAAAKLRAAGICRLNVDLVYGLPGQTLDRLARTLDRSLALNPDRFAVFGYAHVPWMKPRQKLIDAATLPDAALRAEMARLVAERLPAAGYLQVGIDHYARPDDALGLAATEGRLRRNFQGYVADRTPWVVGVGASAISNLPRGFTQNATDTARYQDGIEQGGLATARGLQVDPVDRLRGEIIEQLMCAYRVNVGELCRRHAVETDSFLSSVPDFRAIAEDGLAVLEGDELCVTERGRPLVRFVCAAFDRHLAMTSGRHSRGI